MFGKSLSCKTRGRGWIYLRSISRLAFKEDNVTGSTKVRSGNTRYEAADIACNPHIQGRAKRLQRLLTVKIIESQVDRHQPPRRYY
jgi:hypothetical protein